MSDLSQLAADDANKRMIGSRNLYTVRPSPRIPIDERISQNALDLASHVSARAATSEGDTAPEDALAPGATVKKVVAVPLGQPFASKLTAAEQQRFLSAECTRAPKQPATLPTHPPPQPSYGGVEMRLVAAVSLLAVLVIAMRRPAQQEYYRGGLAPEDSSRIPSVMRTIDRLMTSIL